MQHKPATDESAAPRPRSVAERRMRLEQTLACTRIEGHLPGPDLLADMEAVVTGQLSDDEVRERIVERARAADRRACAESLRPGFYRGKAVRSGQGFRLKAPDPL